MKKELPITLPRKEVTAGITVPAGDALPLIQGAAVLQEDDRPNFVPQTTLYRRSKPQRGGI